MAVRLPIWAPAQTLQRLAACQLVAARSWRAAARLCSHGVVSHSVFHTSFCAPTGQSLLGRPSLAEAAGCTVAPEVQDMLNELRWLDPVASCYFLHLSDSDNCFWAATQCCLGGAL